LQAGSVWKISRNFRKGFIRRLTACSWALPSRLPRKLFNPDPGLQREVGHLQ
jgi:hypothetical protein